MPSPAPCPTPVGCPTPQPCSEIFDAQCVVYTGDPLSCTVVAQAFSAEPNPNPAPAPAPAGPIVNTNDTVAEALEGIVDYICNNSGEGSMTSQIVCATGQVSAVIVLPGTSYNDAIVSVSNYYCGQINNILDNPPVATPQFQYEIGQYVPAQGGIIAHRWLSDIAGGIPKYGTVQNYLVVDEDELLPAQWATINVNISNVDSTWDGDTNTLNLVNAGPSSGITSGVAAGSCFASTSGGKTDWYLPSIDELSKIWQNRWDIAQGITTASGTTLSFTAYWSSTEVSITEAWYFDFFNGVAADKNKSNSYYVRAVRKFSI